MGAAITGELRIDGTGGMRLPRVTVAQRLASPTKADMAWQEDYWWPEVYDGVGYRLLTGDSEYFTVCERLERMAAANGNTAVYPKACSYTTPAGGTASVFAYTTRRITGVAFVVQRPVTVTGIAIRNTAAGTGTQNFSSVGLYTLAANGGWTFLIDSGASSIQRDRPSASRRCLSRPLRHCSRGSSTSWPCWPGGPPASPRSRA